MTENFSLSDAGGSLEFWKDFDLETKRLTLDKSCVEMREMKTASINGRKKLNEATKAFRSKTREEQVLGMTELLKLYQDEIDQLSNRSKFSEKSFYNLYKQVYDAPNPVTAIEGLINLVTAGSTNTLEIERLKSELNQYDEEFQQLKNQDITIRRLEEQLQEYRDQIEDKVVEEVMKRTAEVEDQAGAKVAAVKEVSRAAEKRLAAAVESMRQAQASADRAQTQMFEISSQAEERVSALSAENGILAEGSERLEAQVGELEGEVEMLKSALATAVAGGAGASAMGSPLKGGSSADDTETLQMVVSELRSEIRKKEETFRAERQRLDGQQREVAQQLAREKEALGKVRLELAERPTKDDLVSVRRQLKMLQRVAFNVEDEDNEGVS
jgi:homeobox protein cut-like